MNTELRKKAKNNFGMIWKNNGKCVEAQRY